MFSLQFFLPLAVLHTALGIGSIPFRRLSKEENEELMRTCGLLHSRPPGRTEYVFMARVTRFERVYSGFLISPRHVVSTTDGDNKDFDPKRCKGYHYDMDPALLGNITITVYNSRPEKIRKAINFYGCSSKLLPKASIWVYELEKDIDTSSFPRPICLLGDGSLLKKDTELMLCVDGPEKSKSPVNLTECPTAYRDELFCGVSKNAIHSKKSMDSNATETPPAPTPLSSFSLSSRWSTSSAKNWESASKTQPSIPGGADIE
ncbi:hypothetical protein GCK72_025013 [Caenorhabditis remanei]|uniref:Uncharacterized protein n=1 Tax=Caenorhabditis remanei TaxID=31234 RepID=A0A6A5G0R8_CAERE|nr:hypothetical protein GCK72_025013 [Caenorhabditis remanei]KAF1748546.1 hypothetical protein GCK72_025013 [Caenorhabditis remanei]